MPSVNEEFLDMAFPRAGVDRSLGFSRQPVRPGPSGTYAHTCYDGVNVRAYDPRTDRSRGGSRAGLAKYISSAVVANTLITDLNVVTTTGITPPSGGSVQTSQYGRVVTLVAVCQGNVYTAAPGDTTWNTPANNSGAVPPLNSSGLVFSSANNQKLYFVDGTNYRYYVPATDSVETWVASAGTLPLDDAGNKARLICTWRGRTVLSGLLKDPQNWFMSAVSDPHDFDYDPADTSAAQAVAGNNSDLGFIGDVVTCLIPYTDDTLLFGGDSSIYMMRGDPLAGGQVDVISKSIGIAWGQSWCMDPTGTIYFMSSRTGVYTLIPGQAPVRISQGIEKLLQDLNTGENAIRMLWDDRHQWLNLFVSPTASPAESTHFCYEARTGAWWKDRFRNEDHDPITCCVLDGNRPDDRVALIGSWDGYVRFFDPASDRDDGEKIDSEVWIGPVLTQDLDEVLLKDLQAVLAEDSGDVEYFVHVGETAEAALASEAVEEGVWEAGRNLTSLVRRAGHAIYLHLVSENAWAMEIIRARLATTGKTRRRGY